MWSGLVWQGAVSCVLRDAASGWMMHGGTWLTMGGVAWCNGVVQCAVMWFEVLL